METKKEKILYINKPTRKMIYQIIVVPIRPFFIGMPITLILLLGATILSFMIISIIERYSRLGTNTMEVIYFITIFGVSLVAGYLAGKFVLHKLFKKTLFLIMILTLIVIVFFFMYAGVSVGIIMLLAALPSYIFGLAIRYLLIKRKK